MARAVSGKPRIENELLAEHLSKTEKEPVERITKALRLAYPLINEQTHDDVVKIFLKPAQDV
jgi:hypothetical protein